MTEQQEHAGAIYPAEHVGQAEIKDGILTVGGVEIPVAYGFNPANVYVRRAMSERGMTVAHVLVEIIGDGFAQESLDAQNDEAERYPGGPKEYWRGEMVGKWTTGSDGHLMTEEEFEADRYEPSALR